MKKLTMELLREMVTTAIENELKPEHMNKWSSHDILNSMKLKIHEIEGMLNRGDEHFAIEKDIIYGKLDAIEKMLAKFREQLDNEYEGTDSLMEEKKK